MKIEVTTQDSQLVLRSGVQRLYVDLNDDLSQLLLDEITDDSFIAMNICPTVVESLIDYLQTKLDKYHESNARV